MWLWTSYPNFASLLGNISISKSNIIFPDNTLISIKKNILVKFGFKETSFLGTYLGVPLSGKSPRIKDLWYPIEKVQAKLAHWKRSQLSFAGRVT